MIAPHAMNGRNASGLSLIRTPPSASSNASTGTPEHRRRELLDLSREHLRRALHGAQTGDRELRRVRPREARMRVPVRVVAGADVHVVDRAPEDVGDDLGRGGLVTLALRRRAEGDDDLAEDVELDGRDLVVPRELQLRIDE